MSDIGKPAATKSLLVFLVYGRGQPRRVVPVGRGRYSVFPGGSWERANPEVTFTSWTVEAAVRDGLLALGKSGVYQPVKRNRWSGIPDRRDR